MLEAGFDGVFLSFWGFFRVTGVIDGGFGGFCSVRRRRVGVLSTVWG